MAEEVLKGVLTDSAKSVLGMVTNLIGQEIQLAWGFKDDLKSLQSELNSFVVVVSKVDQSSFIDTSNNPLVAIWMKKVKALLSDAEDVIDEIAYELLKRNIALKQPMISNSYYDDEPQHSKIACLTARFRMVFSMSSNPLVFRFCMAHKVKALKESIADIHAEDRRLGIKPFEFASSTTDPSGENGVLQFHRENPDIKSLVGRDQDIDQLTNWLVHASDDTDNDLNVIGIYGMAGLGKTSLARRLLETERVKKKFNVQIAICVSHDFDRNKLLNNMVEQLCTENKNLSSFETIKKVLREKLKGKKYLLILDDVWETFQVEWEPLRSVFLYIGASNGNTILITSRKRDVLERLNVANKAGLVVSPRIYLLSRLEHHYPTILFKRRLGGGELPDSKMGAIADKLIKRCGGVPLAINTLAGLLRMRKSIEEWSEIEKSKIWDQCENDLILASVKLSFKYLPSVWLKKCFAYCAIFKEDEVIDKAKLIQLWMAQGYLQPQDKMEDIGEEYFNLLLGNFFFQDEKFDKRGNVITCKMHDVVHKLAQVVSGDEVLFSSANNGFIGVRTNTSETQHLELKLTGDLHLDDILGEKLRTLSWSGDCTLVTVEKGISKTRYLRSLSLISVGLNKLPNSIGKLKHLRYLDVSDNSIENFPNGLTKLYNLQTLRILNNFVAGRVFLPRLKHNFCELINLRHFQSDCKMGIPYKLGKISGLQTIPPLDLRMDWGGKLSELGKLSKLKGKLTLIGLEKVGIEEAMEANLGSKANIEELHLEWNENAVRDYHGVMIRQLKALQPHPKLASLTIKNYTCNGRIPKWFRYMIDHEGSGHLSKIVNLEIRDCDFMRDSLYIYASSLKTLYIENCHRLYNLQLYSELLVEFTIKRCHIRYISSLRYLAVLEILRIGGCHELISIEDLPRSLNLRHIEIVECRKLTRLPEGLAILHELEELELGPFSSELDCFPFPDIYNDQKGYHIGFKSVNVIALKGGGMDQVTSLPDQIQYLLSLTTLQICDFYNLEELPDWLGNIGTLQALSLHGMPNLKSLPSQTALRRLTYLYVFESPLLEQACAKEIGRQWSNIQHIPHIVFGDETIQSL